MPRELYHLPGFYEPFNVFSHLIAAVLFVLLGVKLVLRGRGRRPRVVFLSIYAFSVVFLLSMSAVFHMMVSGGMAARVMNRLDHAAIFVLIAGTFTGVHGTIFRHWLLWVPMVGVWAVAATCITLKTVFFDTLPEAVTLSFYLGLGWGVGLTAIPLFKRHGARYLAPLFYGGAAYSLGAVVHVMNDLVVIPGVVHAHEVWHLVVLLGAIMHWCFVWNVVTDEVAGDAIKPA